MSELVIEGEDGWLFLAEGSNFSISQMTGEIDVGMRNCTDGSRF